MPNCAHDPGLNDHAVFIAGGATDIGAAMVEACCAQAAQLGYVDIDQRSADDLARRFAQLGYEPSWFRKVDVTDVDAPHSAIDDFCNTAGGLNMLINNVALKQRIQPKPVSHLALFLASDDSQMMTNQQFLIDWGRI